MTGKCRGPGSPLLSARAWWNWYTHRSGIPAAVADPTDHAGSSPAARTIALNSFMALVTCRGSVRCRPASLPLPVSLRLHPAILPLHPEQRLRQGLRRGPSQVIPHTAMIADGESASLCRLSLQRFWIWNPGSRTALRFPPTHPQAGSPKGRLALAVRAPAYQEAGGCKGGAAPPCPYS